MCEGYEEASERSVSKTDVLEFIYFYCYPSSWGLIGEVSDQSYCWAESVVNFLIVEVCLWKTISSVTILLVIYDWELIPVSRYTDTVLLQSINKIVLCCVIILLCCCYWYWADNCQLYLALMVQLLPSQNLHTCVISLTDSTYLW